MRNFKDVMKVSAVGAILLSALAACNGKPESNPTPPSSDDGQLEVIIEQVVDGKVIDTRAVGRTDVVKYGTGDGSEVAYIDWPDNVSSTGRFNFTYHAKPGLYLEKGAWRSDLGRSGETDFSMSTVGQTTSVAEIGTLPCNPDGAKKIYVRLEYENVNNPNEEPTERPMTIQVYYHPKKDMSGMPTYRGEPVMVGVDVNYITFNNATDNQSATGTISAGMDSEHLGSITLPSGASYFDFVPVGSEEFTARVVGSTDEFFLSPMGGLAYTCLTEIRKKFGNDLTIVISDDATGSYN